MIEKISKGLRSALMMGSTTLAIAGVGMLYYKGVIAPIPSAEDLERACKSLTPGTGQMEVFQLLPHGKPKRGQLKPLEGGGSQLAWSSKPSHDTDERTSCNVSFDSEGRVIQAQVIR